MKLRRLPWQLLPVLAAAAGVSVLDGRATDVTDLSFFVHAGEKLISSHALQAFADPGVQAGPLQLLVYGLGGRLAAVLDVAPARLLAPVVELGFVALLVFTVGRVLAAHPMRRRVQLAVGLLAVAVGTTSSVFHEGHPAGGFVPLLWVLAAVEARDGRPGRAGVLVGLSATLETWGALGIPVLLLVPELRRSLRGLTAAAAVALACFGPFLAAGDFHMLRYRWPVAAHSLVGHVLEPGTAFGWDLRLLQGGAAVACGAALAVLARRKRASIWLVSAVVAAVRLLLDPLETTYYLLAVETLGLVALAGVIGHHFGEEGQREPSNEPPWRGRSVARSYARRLPPGSRSASAERRGTSILS